jgi:hypothetical protein
MHWLAPVASAPDPMRLGPFAPLRIRYFVGRLTVSFETLTLTGKFPPW